MTNATRQLRSRREFLRLAGLAGLGAMATPSVLGACVPAPTHVASESPTGAAATGRVRIGYLPITDAAPLLLAHVLGLYTEEGLVVERPTLFRGWSQIAEAFQADQLDVVHLLMPMTIWLRYASQVPLKVVAWDHTGGSALTVAHSVESVTDLAGTTVAIPFWYSIHNVVLQLLLRQAGLEPLTMGEPSSADGTVKLVVMPPPEMAPALANGSITGYIVADPFNAVAELNDIGRVLRFLGDVWYEHACCVVTTSERLTSDQPDVAQAVVNAIARGQLWARNNRSEAARLLSQEGESYLPQPLSVIQRALEHYDLEEYGPSGAVTNLDWQTERIGFQPYPFPSYTQELVRLLRETMVEGDAGFLADLDPAAAHEGLVDERFARAAIESLGGPSIFGLPEGLVRTERIAP